MFIRMLKVLSVCIACLLISGRVFAQVMDGDAEASDGMAARLACYINQIFQSDIGLLIGLIFAIMGLVKILRTGAYKTGLVLIIAGALITAVPSLIISSFSGLSAFLNDAKISEVDSGAAIQNVIQQDCSSIPINFDGYNPVTALGSMNQKKYGSGANMTKEGGQIGDMTPMSPEEMNAMTSAEDAVAPSGCNNLVKGGSRFTSGFGPRTHPISGQKGRMHKGLDYAAPAGREIVAAAAGRVVKSRYNAGGWGNYVVVDHGGGMSTLYGHMKSPGLPEGTQVAAGQGVGFVGSTGGSTGNHLHFEVHKNGTAINPASSSFCGGGSSPASGAAAARS